MSAKNITKKSAKAVIDRLKDHDFDAEAACDAEGIDIEDWQTAVEKYPDLQDAITRKKKRFAEAALMRQVAKGDRHAIRELMEAEPTDAGLAEAIERFRAAMDDAEARP